MAASIKEFTSSGLLSPLRGDGFVFGVLKHNETTGILELDVGRNRELVALAKGGSEGGPITVKCVLHRAVDDLLTGAETEDEVGRVLEEVRDCGFDGMLTSGGRGSAVENVGRLKEVVRVAGREGVEVIVGGGVRRDNLAKLVNGLKGENGIGERVWFHSSCLGSDGRFDEEEAAGLAEELRHTNVLL
jgi:copper homeostasis protein CutC